MSPNPQTRAVSARCQLMRQLCLSDLHGTTALAVVLNASTDHDPCGSAACRVCGLDFQVDAVSVIDRFIGEPSPKIRGRKAAIAMVPASGIVAPSELAVAAFERVWDQFKAAFIRLRIAPQHLHRRD